MRRIYRVPLVMLTTAAAVSLGVVGVQASTQCVRFVRQKIRHHKVTAATAARWTAWNKAHPNWHPKRTPQETLAQIDFACKVPVEQTPPTEVLPTIDLGKFSAPIHLPAPPEGPPVVVATDLPPRDLFPLQPSGDIVNPPIYPPESPVMFGPLPVPAAIPPINPAPAPEPTPEPAGWLLMATATVATAAAMRRSRNATL